MEKKTLYMIGNTHFDPVWLWKWDEGLASIRSTFRSALDRMNEDPDFTYSFCTPAVFEMIEKVDRQMFEEIAERVKENRWDIRAEGWWLQPDCNMPSGESLVRQGLYGQRYIMRKFDVKATTVFNIDSFGHSLMMPQILKKSGIDYYIFSRPGDYEYPLDDALFMWQSPDGSRITAYRPGGRTGGEMYPQNTADSINNFKQHVMNLNHDAAVVYGVSNHGGAPTKKHIQSIRGAMENETDINVRFGSTTEFFENQEHIAEELNIIAGELQPKFYGAFSNSSEIKNNNRTAEYAVMNAEKAAVFNLLTGVSECYPAEMITQSWKDILYNQFHDILGGTCIPGSYTDARNLHGRAIQTSNEITHFALQRICRNIKTPGNNNDSVWNSVVFNLNPASYKGIIECEVQWAWEHPWYKGGIELTDENGTVYKTQVIAEYSAIPGFRTRFAFEAEIPAMGYKTFAVRTTNESITREFTPVEITSPFKAEVYQDSGDTWCFNTTGGYGGKLGEFDLVSSKITEQGLHFTTVKKVSKYNDSILEEYFTAYANHDYIDYRYRVNWNERHTVLKLKHNEIVESDVTCAVPYGHITREIDGFEHPAGEWMKFKTSKGNTTLLLNGIYAYDNTEYIRLTALRSPIYGDLRLAEGLDPTVDYQYLGQGIHEGKIRVIPEDLNPRDASASGINFNNPVIAVDEANHGGVFDSSSNFVSVSSGSSLLNAIKKAEDSGSVVIRIAECNGCDDSAVIKISGYDDVKINIAPYEIKTIMVDKNGYKETDMLEI